MNKYAQDRCGLSAFTLSLLDELVERGKNVVLVLFGSPYSLEYFKKVGTVVLAYEDDVEVQKAAAKVIAGVLKPEGGVPV